MTDANDGKSIPLLILMCGIVVFQTIALVRYWQRLPQDWLGIGLYASTILLAGIGVWVIASRQGV